MGFGNQEDMDGSEMKSERKLKRVKKTKRKGIEERERGEEGKEGRREHKRNARAGGLVRTEWRRKLPEYYSPQGEGGGGVKVRGRYITLTTVSNRHQMSKWSKLHKY